MSVWLKHSVTVVLTLVYLAFCFTVIYLSSSPDTMDVGVRAVKLLYDFGTPRELQRNQEKLGTVFTQEVCDSLTINNTMRQVSGYQKFHYSESKVDIIQSGDGFVVYRLVNDEIEAEALWLFQYTVNGDGKIDSVKEYRVVHAQDGGYKFE